MSLKGDNNLLRRRGDIIAQEVEQLQVVVVEKDKEITKLKKRIQEMEETIVKYPSDILLSTLLLRMACERR